MAHEIDQTTGEPAIAYSGERPWHGLGQALAKGADIDTWLKAARLNWELMRLPVQYYANGSPKTMDDRFVLARSDTHAALSIVSGDYHVVQPGEVLEFYRELMDKYGYSLETAGALDGGRKVWALARTDKEATVGNKDDKLAAFVLLATSCDKTLATTAAFTSIRVVCQNTLFFAQQDIKAHRRPQVKVNHSLRFDAGKVKEELGLIEKPWQDFTESANRMAAHPMNPEDASSYFEDLLRQRKDQPLSNKAQREHQTIVGLFKSGPGQNLSSARGTLWGAVNAISYYTDHVRPGSGDRLDSAWFGAGYVLKEKAWAEASRLLS